ncbi:hypothetical protein RYX36_030746 [Vicia faba]
MPTTILDIPQIPSSLESTPPNSPTSPIIIPDSPTPSPKSNPTDNVRLVIDLTALERLAAISHKTAIPKPKPTEPTPDVGISLLMFETGMQKWITSLKQASLEMTNPAASDYLWTSFRNWLSSETLKLKEQSYEQVQQNFSDMLKVFEDQVLSHLLKK